LTAAAGAVSLQAMEIVLPPEVEKLVEEKVASGEYPTAADVLRAALHLLDERDRVYRARLDELRAEIRKGLASGDPIPADTVLAGLHAKGKARNLTTE
jgi:antitoxin ParD1/3/4